MIAKKSNWGPRSRLKMKMKAGRMVFPTHYFTLVSEKNEIALILPQKVIQSRFFDFLVFCKIRPWTRSDPGIGRIVAVAVKISPVCSVENHYSNREVDELDEQKVNFKSQPNKEKSYLWILPVLMGVMIWFRGDVKAQSWNIFGQLVDVELHYFHKVLDVRNLPLCLVVPFIVCPTGWRFQILGKFPRHLLWA